MVSEPMIAGLSVDQAIAFANGLQSEEQSTGPVSVHSSNISHCPFFFFYFWYLFVCSLISPSCVVYFSKRVSESAATMMMFDGVEKGSLALVLNAVRDIHTLTH